MFSAIPEDGVRHESEDEDNVNPDERNPQSITDKRIAPDNEFSDSEDEGMAPGVGGGGRKDNRYVTILFILFKYNYLLILCIIFYFYGLGLSKQWRPLENKHVWIQVGWKLMTLNSIYLKVE